MPLHIFELGNIFSFLLHNKKISVKIIAMFTIEKFIMQCSNSQAAVFCYLREMILSCSREITEEVRDNAPHYDYFGGVCYINHQSSGETVLSFCHGNELEDPFQQLKNDDRYTVRSLRFSSIKEVDYHKVLFIVRQALLANKVNAKVEGNYNTAVSA